MKYISFRKTEKKSLIVLRYQFTDDYIFILFEDDLYTIIDRNEYDGHVDFDNFWLGSVSENDNYILEDVGMYTSKEINDIYEYVSELDALKSLIHKIIEENFGYCPGNNSPLNEYYMEVQTRFDEVFKEFESKYPKESKCYYNEKV